jgi:hypothetical protein
MMLVVGLVATLASLWVPNFLAVGPTPAGAPAGASRRPRILPKPTPAAEVDPEFEWETADLLLTDPFQAPDRLRADQAKRVELAQAEEQQAEQKESDDREAKRAALARVLTQKVTLIVETTNGPAARLGSKLIRVGDAIEGFKVERITKDGIYLSSGINDTP